MDFKIRANTFLGGGLQFEPRCAWRIGGYIGLARTEKRNVYFEWVIRWSSSNARLDGFTFCRRKTTAVIKIVIGNILKNAVKYTNKDEINIFVENDEVIIQDYGPGIDRTTQASLFDRFNRGQHRNSDGSGIGLALVRRFCEQYAGGPSMSVRI